MPYSKELSQGNVTIRWANKQPSWRVFSTEAGAEKEVQHGWISSQKDENQVIFHQRKFKGIQDPQTLRDLADLMDQAQAEIDENEG